MKNLVEGVLKADSGHLRAIKEADPVATAWDVAKQSTSFKSIWHLEQISRVKKPGN